MKRHFLIASCMLALLSCKKENPVNPATEAPTTGANTVKTWHKLDLPKQLTVYSMYGKINGRFLAGTSDNILKSDDGGSTWDTVLASTTIDNFHEKKDTLFGVSGIKQVYSVNKGSSWSEYTGSLEGAEKKEIIKSKDSLTLYKLVQNFEGELAYPTSVLESKDKGKTWKNIFPYKHYIYSIYLDENDVLYLGINGWPWNKEKGWFDGNTTNAIIYYLK